jgi:hypothetical protein
MKSVIVFSIALTVCACNLPSRKDIVNELNKANKSAPVASVAPKGWQYTYSIDKMTSDTIFNACAGANEKLDFKFPYNGGSTATLIVYFSNGFNDLALAVSKGQFDLDFGVQNVRIRFDNEKPLTVKCQQPVDRSSQLLIFSNTDTLISELRKAKKILVEATFYREGTRIMEFDAGELVWKHFTVKPKTTKKVEKTEGANKGTKVNVNYSTQSYSSNGQDEDMQKLTNDVNKMVENAKKQMTAAKEGTDNPEIQAREIVDRDKGTVTLVCKYHNKGNAEKTVTLNAKFYNNQDKVVAIRSVTITCSGNASVTSQIMADGLGSDYKTYKLDIE